MSVTTKALDLVRSLLNWRAPASAHRHPGHSGGSVPPGYGPNLPLPGGDLRQWARATVEKIRTAAVTGVIRFLPILDQMTEETDEIRRQYRVMLREPTLKAALRKTVLSVAHPEVQAEPEDSDDPRQQKLAELTLKALKKLRGGTTKLATSVLYPGLVDGWSFTEVVMREFPERTGPFAGKLLWDTVKSKDTHNLQLVVDAWHNVLGVKANLYNGGHVFQGGELESFLLYTNWAWFENPRGMSEFRAAYRCYWIKDTTWKLRSIHLDRYTTPYLMGTYTSLDQRAALEEALEEAHGSSWTTVPAGALVQAIDLATRGTADYEAAIRDCDKEMYTSFAGAYLQQMEGDTPDGRGNTQTQQEVTELLEWHLATQLGQLASEKMVAPWVRLNWHALEPPTVTWGAVSEKDMEVRARVDEQLQKIGLKLSIKEAYGYYRRQRPADQGDVLGGDQGGDGGGGGPGGGGAPQPPGQPPGASEGGALPGGDEGQDQGDGWGGPSQFGESPQHWHAPWEDLSCFAEEDWVSWTLKSGPRKGQQVYKNTKTGKLSDTKPGAKKKPAGAEKKPAGKKPPAKADPAEERARQFFEETVPTNGPMYSVPMMRDYLGLPKEQFDALLWRMRQEGKVELTAHSVPAGQGGISLDEWGDMLTAPWDPNTKYGWVEPKGLAKKLPAKGKKPPPPGKPPKLTVDQAHAHVQALIDHPPADLGAAVKDVVQRLSTGLTGNELAELAKKLGLTGGGSTKEQKAQKLLDKALARPKTVKEKKPPKPKAEKKPAPEKKPPEKVEPGSAGSPKEVAVQARQAIGGLIERSRGAPGDGYSPKQGYMDKSTAEGIDAALFRAEKGHKDPIEEFVDRIAAYKAKRAHFPDDDSHRAVDAFVASQLASYNDDEVKQAAEARQLPGLQMVRTKDGGHEYRYHQGVNEAQTPAYVAFLRERLGAKREGEEEGPVAAPKAAPKPPAVQTPKADKDTILSMVDNLSDRSGQASLAHIGRRLGWTPQRLHAAANALRAEGVLTGAAVEGRAGVDPADRKYHIPEPGGGPAVGYVSRRSHAR